jgi:hypothetical protein
MRGDTGGDKGDTKGRQSDKGRHRGRHMLTLWRTRADMAAHLQCSPRTIQRKVRSGEIERQEDGPRPLYRLRATGGNTGGRQSDTILSPGRQDRGRQGATRTPASEPLLLLSRVEEQAVEIAQLRAQVQTQLNQLNEADREKERWEARARRWRATLKKHGLV